MDRRIEERYAIDLEARVTVLGAEQRCVSARLFDISKSGVGLRLACQLAPGDPIRLEIAGSMMFGHVAYSTADGAAFRTGIEVYRVMLGGTDLSQLLQTLLRQEMPDMPGVESSDVYLG